MGSLKWQAKRTHGQSLIMEMKLQRGLWQFFHLLIALFITFIECESLNISDAVNRSEKLFNIFQITNFPNSECNATNGDCGTCLTASGCSGIGGQVDGACASGFGSCCVLYTDTCGGTIKRNRTYIRNPGFPSGYTEAGTCTYTFEKCSSDVCQIRLDYETHTTAAPSVNGFCLTDTVEGDPVTGPNTPVHCGENAGQHMYLDAGAFSSDSATLTKTLTGSSSRTWKIKVSMIECGSRALPPPGCLQYHTGTTGTVRSFNFLAPAGSYEHLRSQFYQVCVRRNKRFCKIGWTQSNDPDSFKLSRDAIQFGSRNERFCAADALKIPAGSNGGLYTCYRRNPVAANAPLYQPTVDRYCGGTLNCWDDSTTPAEVVSDIIPFRIGVEFNPTEQAASNNRGFCLNYRQITC